MALPAGSTSATQASKAQEVREEMEIDSCEATIDVVIETSSWFRYKSKSHRSPKGFNGEDQGFTPKVATERHA